MGAIARTPARTFAVAVAAALTVVLTVGLTMVLTACGSETTGTSTGTTSSPASASGGASSTPGQPGGRMTEGISQPLVLVRTGGIGGLQDRLEVRPDGTYTVTTKGKAPVSGQLSEGQLAAIVHALQLADLPHLATQSPTESRSDQLHYTLQAEGTTFTTSETTVPDALRPLLEQLGALLGAPATSR